MSDTSSDRDRGLVLGCAFGFWLLVPFPFWLLGFGLTGHFAFWPSFEPDIALLSTLWVIAFYGPLLLIAFVVTDAMNEWRVSRKKETSKNAAD